MAQSNSIFQRAEDSANSIVEINRAHDGFKENEPVAARKDVRGHLVACRGFDSGK